MESNFSVSAEHAERHGRILREWLTVQRHYDFFMWLQGEIQYYLPHEIMLAAWGNFNSGIVRHDIISALIGVRTSGSAGKSLSPLLQGAFNRWVERGEMPYSLHVGESAFLLEGGGLQCPLGGALQGMNSMLVHGISDKRGRHDCLYLVFSSKKGIRRSSLKAIRILLPYLDAAFGRLEPPPCGDKTIFAGQGREEQALEAREIEILNWTRAGRTVPEIAAILNMSVFAAKNHLENILRKLDFRPIVPPRSKASQEQRKPCKNE